MTTRDNPTTSRLQLIPAQASPPRPAGRACAVCGQSDRLLIESFPGTFVCLNMDRCGGAR